MFHVEHFLGWPERGRTDIHLGGGVLMGRKPGIVTRGAIPEGLAGGESGAKCSTWNICGVCHGCLARFAKNLIEWLWAAIRELGLGCFPTLAT